MPSIANAVPVRGRPRLWAIAGSFLAIGLAGALGEFLVGRVGGFLPERIGGRA
jgi:hypothetical protein